MAGCEWNEVSGGDIIFLSAVVDSCVCTQLVKWCGTGHEIVDSSFLYCMSCVQNNVLGKWLCRTFCWENSSTSSLIERKQNDKNFLFVSSVSTLNKT
jgi:hypothetical protein